MTSIHQQKLESWQKQNVRPYIQIENVSKTFGGYNALDSVSLSIYQGEFFSILGGSGCGKTTLLRLLAGFEKPTSGKIFIDGIDMENKFPYDRPVNLMFQSYALFPHMTVEQNIAFGIKNSSNINNKVKDILDLVEMGQYAKRKPDQLSGGQKQRVALARSLIREPKLLLLDEPLAALDRRLREKTQFELVNIQEKVGITFIMVTHDQEEAMTMSTRMAIIEKGQVKQVGTPTEIYEYPNSKHVAEFIGTMNIFEGIIIEEEADHVVIQSDIGKLYMSHGTSTPVGSHVFVAIRPEKIIMTKDIINSPHNCVRGVVSEIAYLGDVSIYHILVAAGKTIAVTVPNLVKIALRPLQWEDEVYLYWSEENGVVLQS
jgi:putrescine transport system ATP-binding protein